MKILKILIVIFLCAMIGTALNELLLLFIPSRLTIHNIFSSSINPIWRVENLDLIVLKLNFGIAFKFTVLTLAGIITGSIVSLRRL